MRQKYPILKLICTWCKRADSTMVSGDDYIGSNVGGKIYQTSRSTLTHHHDSFFTALLDGSVPSAKDDQGNYLIDRDGEIFRHILNYLRCGKMAVPANFNEFDLLECEADFFLLRELRMMIKMPLSTGEAVGLVFSQGTLFNTTRKTLLREENSFFTKMLNDGIVPRDSQGNYIMDRDGSHFQHVLRYLRDGFISHTDFEPDSYLLEILGEEAEYFQLKELSEHLKSVITIENPVFCNARCNVHIYFRSRSQSTGYAKGSFGLFKRRLTVTSHGHSVNTGELNLLKVTSEKPVTLQHVINHFTIFDRQPVIREISNHCTKLELYNVHDPSTRS